MRILLILVMILAGCSGANNKAVQYFNVETPKPFGYVIGDIIPQRIIIETYSDVTLQAASLPAKGTINRWLDVNEITVNKSGQRYEINLRYQVFYAPIEVKMLTIPGFTILLSRNNETISQKVDDWSFNLSPLRELAIRKSEGAEYMRPDATPSLLPDHKFRYGFYTGLTMSLLLATILAYLYGYFPFLAQRNVFKQALRKIEGLSKTEMEKALHIFHESLNRFHGQPLFQSQLGYFFQQHPEYQQIESDFNWFFKYSNRYFFSSGMVVVQMDIDQLKTFCRACRKIERGSQ